MSKYEKIIKSFSVKKTLNPKVWENPGNPDKAKLNPKVRKALMGIAEEFIDYLGEDVFVEDIILTGSLSNFNWSQFSDFDLHVYVDLEQHGKQSELYKELYDLKKQVFNDKHSIKIFGYDVEVYAQDTKEEHYSSGVYSIMDNEWINEPKKINSKVDKDILEKKIKTWTDKIDSALGDEKSKDSEKKLTAIKERLKKYRESGLEKDGELSYENLVFKFLRRSGYVERLFKVKNKAIDKKLSIETTLDEQNSTETNNPAENFIQLLNNSKFLLGLKNIVDENRTYEYTPGIKVPFSEDVKTIQTALQFLQILLPKWGIDGKYGPETQKAVSEFQKKYKLPETGKVNQSDIKMMLAVLILNGFKQSDLSKIQYQREGSKSGNFTYLNLNTSEGYNSYRDICQNFINNRNSGAGVSGDMMASCAKRYFSQGYVPPELALSQLALEGGLSNNPNARPIKTKNPFNIGNVDTGKNTYSNSIGSSVCAYYDLMTRKYLSGGRKAEDLLTNFVNTDGERYAAETNYESELRNIISGMGKIAS